MCGRKYKNKRSIYLHIKYECGVEPQFKCDLCFDYDVFDLKSMSSGPHFCPKNCGRKYKHRRSLKLHLRYECGIAPQFECEVCQRKFSHRANMKIHCLTIHKIICRRKNGGTLKLVGRNKRPAEYSCPNNCGIKLSTKPSVYKHLESEYEMTDQVEYFSCPNQCGRKYRYKRGLSQHLRYECGVEPKFKCDICDRKFLHRAHLRSHRGLIHKVIS
ncbi:zinc finger protein 225-like [Planococcus citri]|uniref:zinc finger protein 225-like n=1 Tax=Planococcus citri TaxID=170843 RepID=UPI0031F99586